VPGYGGFIPGKYVQGLVVAYIAKSAHLTGLRVRGPRHYSPVPGSKTLFSGPGVLKHIFRSQARSPEPGSGPTGFVEVFVEVF